MWSGMIIAYDPNSPDKEANQKYTDEAAHYNRSVLRSKPITTRHNHHFHQQIENDIRKHHTWRYCSLCNASHCLTCGLEVVGVI